MPKPAQKLPPNSKKRDGKLTMKIDLKNDQFWSQRGAQNDTNFDKNVAPLIEPSGLFRDLQKSTSKQPRGTENETRKAQC